MWRCGNLYGKKAVKMNKTGSRYFLTAKRMDETFLQILEKKDYEYITVKEICSLAGVNRSTFYLHYETINDLLEETVESIFQQFTDHMEMNTNRFIEKINTCAKEELYLITPEYLIPYLKFIQENQNIFHIAFLKTKVLTMDEAYKSMMKYVLHPILDRYSVPEKERDYVMQFYVNGIMGIIKVWLQCGCEDSVEYIEKMIESCVMKPVNFK